MTTIPYEEALAAENPTLTLRSLIKEALDSGRWTREEIFEGIDQARLTFREEGNEAAEDLAAEIMDFMTGFCSPRMRL